MLALICSCDKKPQENLFSFILFSMWYYLSMNPENGEGITIFLGAYRKLCEDKR